MLKSVRLSAVLLTFCPALLRAAPSQAQVLASSNILDTVSFDQVIQKPEGPPPTPRHTGLRATLKNIGQDFLHLPSRTNAFWAGVGGGLALAVHPADDNVNTALRGNDAAHNFFLPGKYPRRLYPHQHQRADLCGGPDPR